MLIDIWRDQCLDYPATLRTAPPVKDYVLHIEPGLGNLDVLVDVIGFGVNQVGATTLTRPRLKFRYLCGT